MSELRPDNRLRVHDDAELEPKASIPGTLASLWVVTGILSLFGAQAVSDEVGAWDRLLRILPAQPLTRALTLTHESLGLAPVAGALEAARHAANEAYLVWRPVEEVAVTEPDEPTVETPEDDRPAHRRAPSKRRVLVIGASSIQFALGVELERRFPTYEKVKVKRHGVLATSLARPDFFDWPKKAEELLREFKPDLVVTNYGGNDAQDILLPDGSKVLYDRPEWDSAFQKLVVDLIELNRRHGAETVMIGMPVMREDRFTKKMARLNRAMQEATEKAGGLYISTWALTSTPDGKYLTSARHQGRRGLLRTSDGVHYSKLGAQRVVEEALSIIERRFRFTPKDPTLAPAEPHAFESKTLGSWVSYVAYRPRTGPEGETAHPLLVLAPGEAAAVSTWPHHPHRKLQAWAQSLGTTLVLLESDALVALDGADVDSEAHRQFVEQELMADLEAQFAPVGGIGILASPGALAETLRGAELEHRLMTMPGRWRGTLEEELKKLSAELRPAP